MLSPRYILPLHDEMVIDLFAGGGGASCGIEQAIGRSVDVAINHDPEAIGLHQANHPQTRHYCADVFEVDPVAVTHGRPVGLLWASPDCKHFSKAKGGKPASKKIRSLAWIVVQWAKAVQPRIICLENVEEFQTWGPLGPDGRPCPQRKGQTFRQWVGSLRNLGYEVECKELRACDFGAPTIRRRLFVVARCDGQPIQWPAPTHGDPRRLETKARGLIPWRSAAECIDWTLPTPSIFERARPLADATLRRIARGIVKYVIEARQPFLVSLARGEPSPSGVKPWGSGNGAARVAAFVSSDYGHKTEQGQARGAFIDEPVKTRTTANRHALVAAFLAKHYGGVLGTTLDQPISTVTSVDHHSLVLARAVAKASKVHGAGQPEAVAALLVKYYGSERDGAALTEPLHTIPTHDRFGLVTVQIGGEPYLITDIGMRMLQPHELFKAQGFPVHYRIDQRADGKPLTKTAQIRMCGNSVCPPVARLLVQANYLTQERRKAA